MLGLSAVRLIRDWLDRLLIDAVPRYCPRCKREAAWRVLEAANDDADGVTCVCGWCGMRLVVGTSLHP